MRLVRLITEMKALLAEASYTMNVAALPPKLKAIVRRYSSARSVRVTEKPGAMKIHGSYHAPEYDNYDYSEYHAVNLGNWTVREVRPVGHKQDVDYEVKSGEALLYANKSYASLYIHPADAAVFQDAIRQVHP